MRFRSASNRDRSKYAFLPQGRIELSLVASAALRRDSSTAFTPENFRCLTLIVPSSLQPPTDKAVRTTTIVERSDDRGRMRREQTTTRATAAQMGRLCRAVGLLARDSWRGY